MPNRRLALTLMAAAAFAAGCATTARTAQGANVAIFKSGSYVTVEDAVVQTADIGASNGVVHTINRVLMPPR